MVGFHPTDPGSSPGMGTSSPRLWEQVSLEYGEQFRLAYSKHSLIHF